ncbi:MAG TPA: malate synthase A [Bryobacteraceae bacterium]|nr:malate synthase A [Bryobacteraceae bacterium]
MIATPLNELVRIMGPATEVRDTILTPEAVQFLVKLSAKFESRRRRLLEARQTRQHEIDEGQQPGFPPETAEVRAASWKIAPCPADLMDRRVEITGPPDRKMIINALNSGAKVFMADFEDSNSPTWKNVIEGQANLRDAVNGTIGYTSPEGKRYEVGENPAVLMVRPRGWHLVEKHFLVEGEPISASLFDFGLYFFHNAHNLIRNGTGPYFYLPKLESRHEARLWNAVFLAAQDYLGISRGTIKATVLIETILAAFEMDEILWELREHSAGLNCGRWDYIFSYIKKFRNRPECVLPDRSQVTMTKPFLASYVELLVATCHRRGAHAMGGMAAQIPIKNDPEANQAAMTKVREDKLREVWAGHDGTWVAHPGLVPLAMHVFDTYMPFPNQVDRLTSTNTTAAHLLLTPQGTITAGGLAINLDVGLRYLAAWLGGNGCVPIYNLMEDAATAEICRAQVWQWLQHGAVMDDGRPVALGLVRSELSRAVDNLRGQVPEEHLTTAAALYNEMLADPDFPEFLTLQAYDHLR